MTGAAPAPLVHAGHFPAEAEWAEPRSARLPALGLGAAAAWVAGMDELLAPLCAPSDVLATETQRSDRLMAYHATLGIEPRCVTTGAVRPAPAACADGQAVRPRLRPYAVTPGILRWAQQAGLLVSLPDVATVRRVNSKSWSTEIAAERGIGAGGTVVRSAGELVARGRRLTGPRGLVVKEPHGVSGAGTLLIRDEDKLRHVARQLERQEDAGRAVELVIEPMLDVACSFSIQLDLDRGGRWRTVGLQETANVGFSYRGSRPAGASLYRKLDRLSYFAGVDWVAGALRDEGYFGPVCLDSLVTRDGAVVTVGEINARTSMGAINVALGRILEPFARLSAIRAIAVAARRAVAAEDVLAALDRGGLLFTPERPRGVVPLATLTLPRPGREHGGELGRLYVSIPYEPGGPDAELLPRVKRAIAAVGLSAA